MMAHTSKPRLRGQQGRGDQGVDQYRQIEGGEPGQSVWHRPSRPPAHISTASTQCVAELIAAHQANAATPAHDGAPAANEAGPADGTADTGGEAAKAAH